MDRFFNLLGNINVVRVCVIVAAGFWGLFWIPLRALEGYGIGPSFWTTAFYLVPFLLMAPFAVFRWRRLLAGGWPLCVMGVFLGSSMWLYAGAYFYTDVIRVLLLYYLGAVPDNPVSGLSWASCARAVSVITNKTV